MKLKLCHLYPDLLNLYGDRGNILCIKKRLQWRGVDCEITPLLIGERAKLTDFDMFFIGGGQDFEQTVLLNDLRGGKGEEIKAAARDGKTFLCICGGYQLMGSYYKTHTGEVCDFLGAVDLYTVGDQRRMIGNCAFRLGEESGGGVVVGFENHSGRTYLGSGVTPLGQVIKGFGNNGEDGGEGVRWKNVFGTYSHGPLLPKNPQLCDTILLTALRERCPDAELAPLPDAAEHSAHRRVADMLGI